MTDAHSPGTETRSIENGTRYKLADRMDLPSIVNTLGTSQWVRAVATKETQGEIQLRYTPQQPRSETPDTCF